MKVYSVIHYIDSKLRRSFCDDDIKPSEYGSSDAVCERCLMGLKCPSKCDSCANESMYAGNGISFFPINKEAKKWFRKTGYKQCWGWQPKYWYWKLR